LHSSTSAAVEVVVPGCMSSPCFVIEMIPMARGAAITCDVIDQAFVR
jgi:hypothetical protein